MQPDIMGISLAHLIRVLSLQYLLTPYLAATLVLHKHYD